VGLGGAALEWDEVAAGAVAQAQGEREEELGGAAPGADQLGTVLVMPVPAGRHLEHHVAVADDAPLFSFFHGWLLFVGRWMTRSFPRTVPVVPGIAQHNRSACLD
jgi:hypothetical protein